MLINLIRNFFKWPPASKTIRLITRGKDSDSFWVKLLPLNSQFHKESFRNVSVNGINFNLDLSEWMEWVLYFGINAEIKDGLYQLVKPGDVIIDAGSNFGETALMLAKLIGPSGKVIGFEPVPYVFEKCRQNVLLNTFMNCHIENIGLSNVSEKLSVNDPANNNSGGIFLTRDNSGVQVNAIQLDQYASENNLAKIDLIKIDVEGFEYYVLKGAERILCNFKPILFIELIDANLSKQNASSFQVIEFLKQCGYISFVDNRTGLELTLQPSMQLNTDVICK